MNLLPSILIATTLAGGTTNIQADAIDINSLQEQLKEYGVESQVITGDISDLKSTLNDLGIAIGSLEDCLPSLPGTTPDNGQPETPDINLPSDTPDTGKPDNGDDVPDTEQGTNQSYVEQVVALVNAERAKVNLPALTMTNELNAAAQIRARETVQSFSHTRPNGSSFSSVLKENGISYRGAGENIAWGQRSPEEVVNAWMNSEGHRANILNKNFTSIGVGYHLNGSTPYWAQLFTY